MKIRTSFFLEQKLVEELKKEARKEDRSKSYIVNKLLMKRYNYESKDI